MNRRSLKQRLLRSRIALRQTLSNILDINRKRKALQGLEDAQPHQVKLDDELRILNQLASTQATLVKRYENDLAHSHQDTAKAAS